ncbi:MAG: DUF1972 domain-containing protein [Cyclobacteriaceae bacterium]|nr:DUF1972 domain-containing protein [Cyclobacteriaceae bacterium]
MLANNNFKKKIKICVIGTVGLPANYGGFETLVDNLVRYHEKNSISCELIVYCSSASYEAKKSSYLSASLKYIPFKANGFQSIIYDTISLIDAVYNKYDKILVLGVSGAIIFPIIRLVSKSYIIINVDGVEWKRNKWNLLTKKYLKLCEIISVKYSDIVISDNKAIYKYIKDEYGIESKVLSYGGDQYDKLDVVSDKNPIIAKKYALSICRIEPENNVHLILEAFSKYKNIDLIVIGNWKNSKYGLKLIDKYKNYENIKMINPIYNLEEIKIYRENAFIYVHGHSAGGTNPSLVEAMFLRVPIYAFDCEFNRNTTNNCAIYFSSVSSLIDILNNTNKNDQSKSIREMYNYAKNNYTWEQISKEYFSLIIDI